MKLQSNLYTGAHQVQKIFPIVIGKKQSELLRNKRTNSQKSNEPY
jgi:hypothetical protein